jgi:hypothetical protein
MNLNGLREALILTMAAMIHARNGTTFPFSAVGGLSQ